MSDSLELLNLKVNQQNQIFEESRMAMYTQELRLALLIKMLEEKGVLVMGEYDKRWPLYLKNDVGAMGPNGVMEGSLVIKIYGEK
jgi:hypothetical protein